MKNAGIAVVLFAFGFAPQQSTIPVVVPAQSGAPVVLSGVLTAARTRAQRLRYTYQANLFFTNASGKGILLSITTVDVAATEGEYEQAIASSLIPPSRKLTRIDDYFFTPYVFNAGATRNWQELLDPVSASEGRSGAAPIPVSATGAVVFVQFTDGTTWGDEKAAAEALQTRRLSFEKLRLLEKICQTQGPQDFVDELMKPSELLIVSTLQRCYRETNKDVRAVIEELTRMLRSAELHTSDLPRASNPLQPPDV